MTRLEEWRSVAREIGLADGAAGRPFRSHLHRVMPEHVATALREGYAAGMELRPRCPCGAFADFDRTCGTCALRAVGFYDEPAARGEE